MHIAIVLMKYNPHGGYERQAKLLADAFVSHGHQVSILSHRWTEESSSTISFVKIPMTKLASWIKVLTFARNVQKHLRENPGQYDQVIAFDRSLGMDIYRAGSACHREWLRVRRGMGGLRNRISMLINPLNLVINQIEKKIFTDVQQGKGRIIVLSEQGARQIQRYYPVSDKRFIVIPPAVDFARFKNCYGQEYRDAQRRALGVSPEETVLLFVGSGFRIKGLEKLLRATAILRKRQKALRLFVVGNDRKGIAQYVPLVQQLGLEDVVQFTGGVQDVGVYYAAADIFVMLSLLETFNVAVIEALSFGLPVVVSEGAGVSDLITGEDLGERLPTDISPDQVASSIERCLAREKEHTVPGARKSVAKQCELDRVVEQYLNVIERKHAS